jgi:YidC/Oxa1 family membrane protein insertase
MKKQQETMKLYNKAGVNPMAGCIPGLMQAPIFYALFQFFPSAISLRQKDFFGQMIYLLSTPFMSYHFMFHCTVIIFVSYSGLNSDFLYMKMTTGDQQMAGPTQEGMPDMAKMMKIMIYVSPLMMLFSLIVMLLIEFVLYLIQLQLELCLSLKIILSTVIRFMLKFKRIRKKSLRR